MPFVPGQSVEWLFTTNKGYGYSWWVPATIVKVNKKKVTIDAQLTAGGTKRVSVLPEKIRSK